MAAPAKDTGSSTARLNVRNSPNGKKLGQLTKGQKIEINDEKAGWYHISSISGNSLSGWVSGKYIKVDCKTSAVASVKRESNKPRKQSNNPNIFDKLFKVKKEGNTVKISLSSEELMGDVKNGVSYLGYSQDYQQLRTMIYDGHTREAIQQYENDTGLPLQEGLPVIDMESGSLKTLYNMDLGVLRLESGDPSNAMKSLNTSLKNLKLGESAAVIPSIFSTGGRWLVGKACGDEEFLPYDPDGYEKVMLLNYKAIAYLLEGKDEAYNVARRATAWQGEEREKFEKELEEARKSLKEEKQNLRKNETSKDVNTSIFAIFTNGFKEIDKHFSESQNYAKKVPSAYVNPFSDYLRGAVMEFSAQKDDSKIDDAARAYKEASKLNPDSKILRNAAKEMKALNDDPSKMGGGNLLHVVVAEGFAPEKKVLTYVLPVPEAIIPIRLTTLAQKKSAVTKIKLISYSPAGQTVTSFDQISNISAMSYRYQKDAMVINNLELLSSVLASYAKQKAGGYFGGQFGQIGALALESFAHPDTRTWTCLPSKIFATRLRVPTGTKNVRVVSYGSNGKELASQKIAINPNGHNFVYGRSVNSKLTAQASKDLWVNNL